MLGTYHYNVLTEILRDIHFLYQTDKIFGFILENIIKAVESDAGSFYITQPRESTLKLRGCIGPKKSMMEVIAEELPFNYGKGICGWVAQQNQPLMIDNVQNDHRFDAQLDRLMGYKTKSILCVPVSFKGEVLGVIEMINKKNTNFNANDLEFVQLVARQAGVALENGRLYNDLISYKVLYEGIISNITSGIICTDVKGFVTYVNPVAEKILFVSAKAAVGSRLNSAYKDYPVLIKTFSDLIETEQTKSRDEFICVRTDQSSIKIGFSTFLIAEEDKKAQGVGIVFQNITQY